MDWSSWYRRVVRPSIVSTDLKEAADPEPVDFPTPWTTPWSTAFWDAPETSESRAPASIVELPMELICRILEYLELYRLVPLASVSHRWKNVVEDILNRRRHLTKWDLPPKSGHAITNCALKKILPRMPALRLLCVGGRSYCSLDVNTVSRHCPQLEEVDLDDFLVSKSSLLRLCRSCPRLAVLTLPSYCSESLVEIVLRNLRCLRELSMDDVDLTSGRCLALLPPSLQRLTMTGSFVEDGALAEAARCPGLRRLDVSREYSLPWEEMVVLLGTRWFRLEWLDAHRSEITDNVVRRLPKALPRLRHLNLADCSELTASSLECLGRLKKLRTLNISEARHMSNVVLKNLEHATRLTELTVGVVHKCPYRFSTKTVTRLVTALPRLEYLEIITEHKDFGLEDLTNMAPNLRPGREVMIKVRVARNYWTYRKISGRVRAPRRAGAGSS